MLPTLRGDSAFFATAPVSLRAQPTLRQGPSAASRHVASRAEPAKTGETTMTKDGAPGREPQDIIFNPYKEGATDIAKVDDVEMNDAEGSLANVFYARDSEVGINEQINHEYVMSYVYHQMSSYFNRDNVSLPGLRDFFKASSLEERSHAQQLMDYQATRGGRVKLATIMAPETEYNHPEKGDALHAMEIALGLEKTNFRFLYKLHEVAERNDDGQMADFVEAMMDEQAKGVKEVAEYVAKLRRVGKGLGVYEFDKDIAPRAASMASEAITILAPQ